MGGRSRGSADRFLTLTLKDERGRHHVPDPEVAEIAVRLLGAFTALAPSFAGRAIRVAAKDLPYFYKAAEHAHREGISPEDYARRQLEAMLTHNAMWPRAIASTTLWESHKEYSSEQRITARYRSQLLLFSHLEPIYGARCVLEDPTTELSPLMRVVLCRTFDLPELIHGYERDAALELAATPLARELFDEEVLNGL